MNYNKGQIVLGLATAISLVIFAVGTASAFFVGQGRQDGEISVLQNEDANLNKRFDTLENTLDTRFDSLEDLIKANGSR